ncbi:MAG: thioredoxin-disulfide reductase [Candidatus Pacebacteria bacterium CG10_big_fil_rev_8_21_14_0_10_44_11]|nr:MAG: thioredoxin-disulfide reductase [Candidatus Pacebacteria bacterium CG10_big_fil_rev_8_21_14_0_10_44_11]
MEAVKVVIIGSGPAGYTAAIYSSRAQLKPVLFAGPKAGGQLMLTAEIENFPGFKEGINGPDLMIQMMEQAQRFGTVLKDDFVTAVDFSVRPFKIWTTVPEGVIPEDLLIQSPPEKYTEVRQQIIQTEPTMTAESVLIATGATALMLKVPGEEKLIGKGVSTCAVCDAAFYKDKVTYVIGGGDSAMEDSLALTKFAKSVTIVHRRDAFKASKIMQERVLSNPKVNVLWNSAVDAILGDTKVTGIKVTTNGTTQELPAEGIFVAIGHKPVTQLFANQIQLDDHGYIVTRQSLSKLGVEAAQAALTPDGKLEYPTMTSVQGVFAAGDNVDIRYRQAITAAGQGCAAALDVERWLEMKT